MRVGLIGNGFVGRAIYENLKQLHDFLIFDKNPKLSDCDDISHITKGCKYIFVAVPTPMHLDGSPDLSIVFDVMGQIFESYNYNVVILKSTVVPGTCREIKRRFPGIRIVFSPEFLTEANSIDDFRTCNRMIFGGDPEDTQLCTRLIKEVFPDKQYAATDWETAETVKYFINTFLATKVSFANEMKQICDKIGVAYDDVCKLVLLDPRLGKSHFKVPGHDGHMGFGGKCLPKDVNMFISFIENNNIKPMMLEAAWQKNLEVREDKDWLDIEGAVTKRRLE